MTCIVGLEHNGVVYIGGDSAGMDPETYGIHIRTDEKVFINEEMAMGFTSSFRMGQLLRYSLELPEHSARKDDMAYLVTDFIDAIRTIYRDKGFLKKENEKEEGGVFLVGYKRHLYLIDEDFQVAKIADGYAAVGCGGQVALGAMYATKDWTDPIARINKALEAAAAYSGGVMPPFNIVSI